jgi:GNAT superfamily N-acetyltransferase
VVQVTTSIERERPAWDGAIVAAQRLDTPAGSVLSVPARLLPDAPQHASIAEADRWLRAARPTERWQTVEYRWCSIDDPVADLDDAGTWTAPDDPVEEWLRPFNGGVLVATIHGVHAAAVGIKRHDHHAHEIAVVTSAAHRGHGLARRLVAQATRAIHAQGAIALYLHAPDNDASRHVADHVGFHDIGWRLTTSAS